MSTTIGQMRYRNGDTVIRVKDVFHREFLLRGWDATTDDAIESRLFYPSDMFTFEPRETPVTITVKVPFEGATKAVEAIEDALMEADIDWDLDTDWNDE